jgi:alpha-ketoglutarate-dependent taurine dioxygenase
MCFYLYAKSENTEELLEYLKKEENKLNTGNAIHFDVTYALNVCKQMQNNY